MNSCIYLHELDYGSDARQLADDGDVDNTYSNESYSYASTHANGPREGADLVYILKNKADLPAKCGSRGGGE